MNFVIPKKKYMNELYTTIKKLYKIDMYEIVEQMGVRIFFITDKDESFIMVFDVDGHKIDIFSKEEGFLTCHFFLSGDQRGLRTFGVSNYTVEESAVGNDSYCGINYYLERFNHFEADDDLFVTYCVNKPGQKSIVLEEDEVIEVNRYLNKLLIVLKQTKNNIEVYDQDTVCVCDFSFGKNDFEVDYIPLDSIDFFPTLSTDGKEDNMLFGLENIGIKSGVMHMGLIYGFNSYDSYNDITDFEITLCPVMIYGINEEGDVYHIIFSTPYNRRQEITNIIITKFFQETGIYDTIVTDNLFIYDSICSSLTNLGIEVKPDLNDPVNTFITKFMIKMIQFNDDVTALDEMLNNCKKDVKELFLSSLDDLDELNERFFSENPEEEIIREVEEEDDEEDDFFDDEESDGFVS